MKKYVLALFLMFLTLGCTQQTSTNAGIGKILSITDFSSDQSVVYKGDSISLTLSLENKGSERAELIFAKLKSIGTLTIQGSETKTISYLGAGDIDDIEWNLNVPENVIEGETFHPSATVCYVYETEGYKDLLLVDSDWRNDLPTLNEYSSLAPIILSYSTTNQPIRGAREFSLKATATLSDEGFVTSDITSEDEYGSENYLSYMELIIPADVVETEDGREMTVTSEDFECTYSSDNKQYTCIASEDDDDYKNTLKLLGTYADGRVYMTIDDISGSYEKIIRVHARTGYRHCLETVNSFPITLTATTD